MPDLIMNRGTEPASIAACGPGAVRVTGTTGDREHDWQLVHHLARRLDTDAPSGFLGAIPTYESVLVEFDPTVGSVAETTAMINSLLQLIDPTQPLTDAPRHFTVPVLYGGDAGPDLDLVAQATGLGVSDVIRLHAEPSYTVRCLGSPGGSPMLDGPAFGVPVPRLASPRTRVPAGVISVAGRQATIAPASAPGGWCVIGHTPLMIMDLAVDPPVPYRPGDTLSFQPIDADEYAALCSQRPRLQAA